MGLATSFYRGRLNRTTYIGGILVSFLLLWLCASLDGVLLRLAGVALHSPISNVTSYLDLVLPIAFASTCCVRRLHDVGASGKWLLLVLIPVAAPVLGVVLLALPGEQGINRFGPGPSDQLDIQTLLLGSRHRDTGSGHV